MTHRTPQRLHSLLALLAAADGRIAPGPAARTAIAQAAGYRDLNWAYGRRRQTVLLVRLPDDSPQWTAYAQEQAARVVT